MALRTNRMNAAQIEVPERAHVALDDGPQFDAVVQSFWPAGVFVLTDHPDLQYSGGARVTFFRGTPRAVELPAQVATWVRGRGVRLEAAPDAPPNAIQALAAWTRGESVSVSTPPSERTQALSGRRVLVIDDDIGLLRMVARRLRTFGCDVETTDSPSDALTKLAEHPMDAVVMDWMLPEIPGRQLLTAVKAEHRHLPVAVMSGQLCWDGAYEDVVSFGADVVLEKPLDIWRMVDWLQAVTRDSGGFV